jgi:WD40 repeat protein
MKYNNSNIIGDMYYNGSKIKEAYYGGEKVFEGTRKYTTYQNVVSGETSYQCKFTPDGSYIIFNIYYTPYFVFLKRESNDSFTKLTFNKESRQGGSSSPYGVSSDGLYYIVDGGYHSASGTNYNDFFIYKRDGDNINFLTSISSDDTAFGHVLNCGITDNMEYLAFCVTDNSRNSINSNTKSLLTVYKRDGDTFTKLLDLPDNYKEICYAENISFSADGIYLCFSFNNRSSIIYKRNGDTFTKLDFSETLFGSINQVSFSPDGKYLVFGIRNSPYIVIYKRNNDTFTRLPDLEKPPLSGNSFSISKSYLAVPYNASSSGIALYKRENDTFIRLPNIGFNAMGSSLTREGDYLALSSSSPSRIYKGIM